MKRDWMVCHARVLVLVMLCQITGLRASCCPYPNLVLAKMLLAMQMIGSSIARQLQHSWQHHVNEAEHHVKWYHSPLGVIDVNVEGAYCMLPMCSFSMNEHVLCLYGVWAIPSCQDPSHAEP